jgi:hypothetical protein
MHAVAEDKALAKKMDIPQSVAKKFVKEDHGRKLKRLPEHVKRKKG